MLCVLEKNGRWHVYETGTTPWALITAFRTEDEAKAYVGLGSRHGRAVEVKVEGWVAEPTQEDRKCIVCDRTLYARTTVHMRLIRIVFNDQKTETKYEAKCLKHTRTRFDREPPI